jgi:hypothetical protein
MIATYPDERCNDCGRDWRFEHHPDCIRALATTARQGGDVKQAPGEAPQSGPNASEGNVQ